MGDFVTRRLLRPAERVGALSTVGKDRRVDEITDRYVYWQAKCATGQVIHTFQLRFFIEVPSYSAC